MDDFARHGICQRDVGPDIQPEPGLRPLRGTGAPRVHHEKLRSIPYSLEHVMEKDRMRIARVRSPQQDYIRVLDLGVGTGAAARSKDRRQTDDAGGVSSAVTTVDVVAPDHGSHELLRNVIQLVGGLGATEHAERSRILLFDDAAECLRYTIERFVPRCGTVAAILTDRAAA